MATGDGEDDMDGAIDDVCVGDGDGVGVHAVSMAAQRTRVTTKPISAWEYRLCGRRAHLIEGKPEYMTPSVRFGHAV